MRLFLPLFLLGGFFLVLGFSLLGLILYGLGLFDGLFAWATPRVPADRGLPSRAAYEAHR